MCEGGITRNVATHIDRVEQLLLRLVQVPGADIEVGRRQRAVVASLQSILCLGHALGYVFGAEVNVEGGIGAHQLIIGRTIPQIFDGVQRGLEVRAGRMHSYANGRIPAARGGRSSKY